MASACSTAVLIASVVWGISDSSVIQEHGCKSTRVIDGDTGVLKFFLRNDINMSSDELFAYLRRATDLDTDIVQCFRKNKDLAVDCKSVNARYQTDGLINNIITLSIPNVTREFEDTYSLRVYVNNKAEPTITCSLEVIVPTTPDGGTGGTIDDVVLIAVVAGSLGTLIVIVVITVCCLRKIRRSKKKKAFASSIEKEQTFVLKPVPANKKRSKKAADALLPQTTSSTASDVIGTSPRIEVNHTPEQDEFRRRKDGTSEVEIIDNDNYESTKSPPALEAKHNVEKQRDLASEPWYFGNITSEQATKYLLAAENGDGSFLVMDSNGKLDKYFLRVKCNGQVKSRMICVSQSGFSIESHKQFPTVTDLIDHYREHARCFPINLSRPCVRTSSIP